MWQGNLWLLQHDNVHAHSALSIQQFLAKNNIVMLEQPLHLPDLALCDFFLFSKLKVTIKGTCFEDVEAIKRNVTTELTGIPEESIR